MINKTSKGIVSSSFRDPAGFLFSDQDTLYRQINPSGYDDYFSLIDSGLYKELSSSDFLIPHEEQEEYDRKSPPAKIIIKPEPVVFISYPYEWSFSQLKDAALLTLEIQLASLHKGISLKDCSAYNIQFHNGKPILIDTLSFEQYQEGEPWVAYRQFCQHFLCPLALMAYTDVRLSQLSRVYIDGVPLDLASKLLPKKTSLNFALNMHIHLHSKTQAQYADKDIDLNKSRRKMQKHQLLGLVENLKSAIKKLTWQPDSTDWAEYDQFHNYSPSALKHKSEIVADFLQTTKSEKIWDLGANTGRFSRIASQQKINTLAFDVDPGAVELNYLKAVEEGDQYLLPLITDLTNPSPGLGWAHSERQSLIERGPADTILALALVHHIVIGNNVPLKNLVEFLGGICNWLIIEFIPKQDPQVRKLLQVRKDIFAEYNQKNFLNEFNVQFELITQEAINDTERELFLFRKRNPADR
jgi:ribosomal protein L11 methylase PrmA